MKMSDYKPIPGSKMFDALANEKCIVMTCNTRITKGVARGIFRAAKDTDSPVMFELAKSECDLKGGYTGLTPADFSRNINEAAREVGYDIWALHADHIGVKKGDAQEMKNVKELVQAQIDAGYTSFAIDASHLFNFEGKDVEEQLMPNIKATIELARFIKENMKGKEFGLEVEVGEIGWKNRDGVILTTPEEAVEFIRSLKEEGIVPHLLAISNGSAHGNAYDKDGNLIEQVSIDIPRTKEIVSELKKNDLKVKIAQHGITGTPRDLIYLKFPHGDILKGNVGTFWQNLVFNIIKVYDPVLYADMYGWILKEYKEKAESKGLKNPEQIFGTFGKFSIKQFFERIYSMDSAMEDVIEAMTYAEALVFFRAFKAEGKGAIVRKFMNRP